MRTQESIKVHLARLERCQRCRHDDKLHFVLCAGHRRSQGRQQRTRHQYRLRSGILQHVGVIICRQQGIDRNWHQARVKRA